VRRWFVLACLLASGSSFAAEAGGARVRWRGVSVDGHGPARLQSAAAAHVAVALRQLGSTLTVTAPADAEAQASCLFVGNKRVARCLVEVSGAGKTRAQRRAEIPYRDAEDLAESLSLLVSDVLTAEFPDVLAPHGAPKAAAPEPVTPPPQPVTPPQPPVTPPPIVNEHPTVTPPPRQPPREEDDEEATQRRLAAERARQERLAEQADRQEAAEREAEARQRGPSPPPPERLSLDAAGTVIVGLGADNPSLYGGAARVLWNRGLLRLGGTLSLAGVDATLDGHALGFFRAAVAARAGVGVSGGAVAFDATAGPALVVLATDANRDGRHAVASFALVIGPRLSLRLAGALALVVGLDVTLAVTDEKVTLGPTTVAEFSRAVAEITLGLSWGRPLLRRAATVTAGDTQ
jgi:outer membrane biosynthesis protein TonB